MVWQMIGSMIGSVASKAASSYIEQSRYNSAAQAQYVNQSKLNKQAYKYSLKLQNAQNAFNESMMNKANEYNSTMVENANNFTSDMFDKAVELTNTAHQREVEDLRKAGLNPVLSANSGAQGVNPLSGATLSSAQASSGSATMSGGSASMPGVADMDLLSAVQTGLQLRNDYKLTNSNLETQETSRNYTKAQEKSVLGNLDIAKAQSASQIRERDANIEKIRNDMRNDNLKTRAEIANLAASTNNYNENSATSRNSRKYHEVTRRVFAGPFSAGYSYTPNAPQTMPTLKSGSLRTKGSMNLGKGFKFYNTP